MSVEILVVDDEAAIVSVLARSLRAHGYGVRVAATGADALLALTEALPDILLLDVNLPDLTGWEVLRRIPAPARAQVAVVVFSASPLAPGRVQEFQPAGVLVKPFPMDALLRLIDDVATRRRAAAAGVDA